MTSMTFVSRLHQKNRERSLVIVSQPRLSCGNRESGQIPIRLLYCILSSRAPNEVGVNINWDAFCKGRSSVSPNNMPKKATARLHLSLTQLTRQEILGVLETRWWWEIDHTLSSRVRVWAARLAWSHLQTISLCWASILCNNYYSFEVCFKALIGLEFFRVRLGLI